MVNSWQGEIMKTTKGYLSQNKFEEAVVALVEKIEARPPSLWKGAGMCVLEWPIIEKELSEVRKHLNKKGRINNKNI